MKKGDKEAARCEQETEREGSVANTSAPEMDAEDDIADTFEFGTEKGGIIVDLFDLETESEGDEVGLSAADTREAGQRAEEKPGKCDVVSFCCDGMAKEMSWSQRGYARCSEISTTKYPLLIVGWRRYRCHLGLALHAQHTCRPPLDALAIASISCLWG